MTTLKVPIKIFLTPLRFVSPCFMFQAKQREAVEEANAAEAELADILAKAEALERSAEEKTDELNMVEEELDATEKKIQEQVSFL